MDDVNTGIVKLDNPFTDPFGHSYRLFLPFLTQLGTTSGITWFPKIGLPPSIPPFLVGFSMMKTILLLGEPHSHGNLPFSKRHGDGSLGVVEVSHGICRRSVVFHTAMTAVLLGTSPQEQKNGRIKKPPKKMVRCAKMIIPLPTWNWWLQPC